MPQPLQPAFSPRCLACLLLIFLLLPACSSRRADILKIGEPVPSFSTIDLNGQTVSLEAYQGRPVILRFFLTDCRFCKADTPAFNALFKTHLQEGLQIVYINDNAADVVKVREFAENLGITFPVVFDPEARIAKLYGVRAQPLTLVLDRDHRLRAALLGGVAEVELREAIDPHLK